MMCSQAQLKKISSQMVESYKRAYGGSIVEILLYGSYARGDNDPESDIDYTAIVRGERRSLQDKLEEVWDDSAEIGLENDVIVSPTVIPADEFEKYSTSHSYYMNIRKEGIRVG